MFDVKVLTRPGLKDSRLEPPSVGDTVHSRQRHRILLTAPAQVRGALRGKSAKQRAQALISIAQPDFRAELTAQARRIQLL